MLRAILLLAAAIMTLAAGRVFSQDKSLGSGDEVAVRMEAGGEYLRLEGVEVTQENIARLADREWQCVVLVGDHTDAAVLEELRHAASIHRLELYGGRISGQIPRLEHVRGLVELQLSGSLDGHDLEALGGLTQLTSLKLPQEMTINTVGSREIAQLTELTSLDMYGVDIDDSGIAELWPLVKLESLDLTHTRVTDEGLKVLSHMPRLRTLELYRHPSWYIKQQISDECLAVIGQLTNLERLSLSGKVTNAGVTQVAKLPRLKNLSILGTEITSAGLAALEGSPVESLALHESQLGPNPIDADIQALAKLKALKHVTVYGQGAPFDPIERWRTAFPNIDWTGISN